MTEYTKCPLNNGDPIFDNMFRFLGINDTNKVIVFLTICVVVRLLLAGITLHVYDKKYFLYLILLGSLGATFILYPKLNGEQWWSRKMHFIIAILIVLSASYQIYSENINRSIPYLLYIDIIIGIITFLLAYSQC